MKYFEGEVLFVALERTLTRFPRHGEASVFDRSNTKFPT